MHKQRDPTGTPTNYVDMKTVVKTQFAVINEVQNARDKLKTMVQTKSVYQYMQAFEAVALRVPNAHDDEMLHAFIWGLKDRIK